jgi:hypothetical protein
MHQQVKLERVHAELQHENGVLQTSWIESDYAEVGRRLKLKQNGEWIDGWVVKDVYPGLLDSKIVQERARDHANHRKATDI